MLVFLSLCALGVTIARWLRRDTPSGLLAVLLVLVVGCATHANPVIEKVPGETDSVARVCADEALTAVRSGRAVMVDVRATPAWQVGHIQGAIPLPARQMRALLGLLPTDKELILYCT